MSPAKIRTAKQIEADLIITKSKELKLQKELAKAKELEGKRDAVKAEAQRRLSEAEAAVKAYVEGEGFNYNELMGKAKKAGSRAPAKPKYQNPNNPAETWTGKGPKPPEWARVYKEQGRLDELLIKD